MPLEHCLATNSRSTDQSCLDYSPKDEYVGVTLIMPVHDRISLSAPALQAVGALSPAPEQIVVVTDVVADSDDGAFLPEGAITVRVPYAVGPAWARNAGVTVAVQKVLLFVDADVVIPTDTVQRVREEFARYPGVAAIFGSYDTCPGDPEFLRNRHQPAADSGHGVALHLAEAEV